MKLKDDEVLENLSGIAVGDTAPLEREKARLERERDNAGLLAQQAISENARVAQDQAAYNERYNELAAEYDRLDEAVKAKELEIAAVKARQRRLEEFTRTLETADEEFTEGLWGSLVEKVTVFDVTTSQESGAISRKLQKLPAEEQRRIPWILEVMIEER